VSSSIRGSIARNRPSTAVDRGARIRQVLEHERRLGYADDSVVGGLAAFVRIWFEGSPIVGQFDEYATAARERRAALVAEALRASEALAGQPSEVTRPGTLGRPTVTPEPRPAHPIRDPPPPVQRAGTGLETPIERLRGVGRTHLPHLEALELRVVGDLLRHYPTRHIDYSRLRKVAELTPGENVTVVASVWDVATTRTRRGLDRIEATIGDETGTLVATWFRRRDYMSQKLRGRQVVLSGRVHARYGLMTIEDPEIEFLEQADLLNTGRLVPIYRATEGLTQRWLRRIVRQALDLFHGYLVDPLHHSLRLRENLIEYRRAIACIHFPEDEDELRTARARLAFDEFLAIQLGVARRRVRRLRDEAAPAINVDPEVDSALRRSLPFQLTHAQRRAMDEISADLGRRTPMARLLQGDVGSGKTVVAASALLAAAVNGWQGLLMAPTEILAEQHGRSVIALLASEPLRVAFESCRGRPGPIARLLIGGTRKRAREEAYQGLADGSIDILIGTHTLVQEGIAPKSLGIAVIDEQHRFGVEQRAALAAKGGSPHVLAMTATPIPRTLAMTVYGEFDLSVLDEMPVGRLPIKTRLLREEDRTDACDFIRAEVRAGHQAYVVCPLVEETEKTETAAATAEYERLSRDEFPGLRTGLLHGRLRSTEKERVIGAFRRGEIDVLVATTVVEVGVDVPNATVMMIEGAERFGLSQLHQLRGRVGRGDAQSYCILLAGRGSAEAEDRLKAVESTTDGFRLAEHDLRLRGPGEFLGTRQSGLPELRIAQLSDTDMIVRTRRVAEEIIGVDPELVRPEHQGLHVLLRGVAHEGSAA